MIFIELTPFLAFRERHWTDDEFGALQRLLLLMPNAGAVIHGADGIRKLRWSAQQRGKRGGTRVIYYWHRRADCIYLIYGYTKSQQANLTARQLKRLLHLLRESVDG
jgi:mRNA-degrading endonuclease RelE of RelBE toxin-antitoxin system